jgi:ribose transport system substrate-binding protein
VESVIRAATILKAFRSSSEVAELRTLTSRTGLNKATAFRLSETLVEAGLLDRIGQQGYRLLIDMTPSRRYRIGYGIQSTVVPFTATVTDSLKAAASASNFDLFILNNNFSAKTALLNADRFVREKVHLVINSQLDYRVTAQIAAKFSDAEIPFVALDMPHPGGFYFGVDNYRAGRLAGRHLAKWALKTWQGEANEIVMIGADLGGPHLKARLDGFHDGLRESFPKARNLQSVYLDTKAQFEATLDAVRKYLRRRKVKRALIGAVNDTTALGALQAFRDFAMEEECAIAGHDACIEAREEMRRPSSRLVCSIAFFPETYGASLIKIATDILDGKPVPPATFIQHELVTPANVNQVYPNDSWMALPDRPLRLAKA